MSALQLIDRLGESPPSPDDLTALIEQLEDEILTSHDPDRPNVTTHLDRLGTLARDEAWRAPLAHAGALDLAFIVLDLPLGEHDLRRLSFRIIANVCADCPEGRQVLSPSFKALARGLEVSVTRRDEDGWTPESAAACAALLNYARDNDEATEQFVDVGLAATLLDVLELAHEIKAERPRGSTDEQHVPDFFWELFLECLERVDVTTIDALRTARLLLASFDKWAMEDIESWASVISKLFTDNVRAAFATDENRFIQLLKLFYRNQLQYVDDTSDEAQDVHLTTATKDLSKFNPIRGPHIKSRANQDLWTTISTVVDQDDFPSTYSSFEGAIPQQLLKWITWPTGESRSVNEYLMQTAMLIIGNLSKLEKYPEFLEQSQLHLRLYDIVNFAVEDQTRALALDLLKHCFLHRSAEVKEGAILKARPGMALALNNAEGILWMCAHASLSAARIMLTPGNVHNLLEPMEGHGDSTGAEPTASYWKRALLVSKESETYPLKLAVGRLVAAVLRCMSSVDTTNDASDADKREMSRFFPRDLDPSEPLGAMLLAGKDDEQTEMVHSEGWFAMALLAKSRRGAELVSLRLAREDMYKKLTEVLATGQEQEAKSSQKVHQRQNVVVMLKRLQKMGLDIRGPAHGQTIEDLLSKLTVDGMVIQEIPQLVAAEDSSSH